MSRGSIFLSPVFVSPANNEAISAATASSTRALSSVDAIQKRSG